MRIDTAKENNNDIKETQIQMTPEDNEILQSGSIPFSQMMTNFENMLSGTTDISLPDTDFKYDTMTMTEDDARFFINLAQNGEVYISMPQQANGEIKLLQTETVQNTVSTRAVEATNKLTELISKAQKTQKPVRIAFDNDISVVLKIDKHGKVTAEFIPGSLEAENYLRNNIASLRQKFDEQNLPYNDLFYGESSRKEQKNKRKNKGEQ